MGEAEEGRSGFEVRECIEYPSWRDEMDEETDGPFAENSDSLFVEYFHVENGEEKEEEEEEREAMGPFDSPFPSLLGAVERERERDWEWVRERE